MSSNVRICPECNKEFKGYGAISRKDNKTIICPNCGAKQAMKAYIDYYRKTENNKEEEEYF